MKKRLFAGILLAALVAGFTAWYAAGSGPNRVRADALPVQVRSLLPRAERYEKQTLEVYVESYDDETGELTPKTLRTVLIYCYDKDERVIREMTYDPDKAEPVLVTNHTYNAEGKPLSSITRLGGEISNELHYTYGADGRELSREARIADYTVKTTFTYDYGRAGQKSGDVVQYAADGTEESRSRYYYDDMGGAICVEDSEGNVETTVERTYDEHDQLVRSVSYRDRKQEMDYRVERTYNAQGKPLAETTFIDGKRHEHTEYAYDQNGYLTRQMMYDGEGKLLSRMDCEQITQ